MLQLETGLPVSQDRQLCRNAAKARRRRACWGTGSCWGAGACGRALGAQADTRASGRPAGQARAAGRAQELWAGRRVGRAVGGAQVRGTRQAGAGRAGRERPGRAGWPWAVHSVHSAYFRSVLTRYCS